VSICCATCDAGRVEHVGESCAACWALEHRHLAIRARLRRAEIIECLAHAGRCHPAELVELLIDIALRTRGKVT
jgi:hypothetical protein